MRCGEADDELQRPIRELCAKDSALIRTSEREREKPLRASISVEADGECTRDVNKGKIATEQWDSE